MLKMFNIWIAAVLTAAALLAGCINDPVREDCIEEEPLAGDVYIRFRINLNSSGMPGVTRAEAGGESETPGTSRENTVETIDLFVYDAGSNELLDMVSIDNAEIDQVFSSNGLTVPVRIRKARTVRIYAAANLPEKARAMFGIGMVGTDVPFVAEGKDYRSVIEELIPGSSGKQDMLEIINGCIPMTGQFISNGSPDMEMTNAYTTETNPLDITADVGRIVAKIHVLATCDTTHTDYVVARDRSRRAAVPSDEEYADWIGWIRWEDVRYMPNGVNKSTYIFAQPNEKANPLSPWKDWNMDLDRYVTADGFGAYDGDFVYYNGEKMHSNNISESDIMSHAEAYAADKLDNTLAGTDVELRYTKGMYCMENYFDASPESAFFDNRDDAIPMVTHVSITAKLTPRVLVIGHDYKEKMNEFIKKWIGDSDKLREEYGLETSDFGGADTTLWNKMTMPNGDYYAKYRDYFENDKYRFRGFRTIKTLSREHSYYILKWSLIMNKLWTHDPHMFADDRFSDGTFYVYDRQFDGESYVDANELIDKQRYICLTAGAVATAKAEDINIKMRSVPHLGGWGYYYTYLDQRKTGGKTPYTSSQVTRNTYYLITITNIGSPGGTITRPEYIKVNTESVGWDYTGKGDINLH